MNYIRTKDGIIDLNRTHLDGTPIYNLDTKENVIKANENKEKRDCYYIENDTIYGYWYLDGCIWNYHIIKQANTIEELCDKVFAFHKESNWEIPDMEDYSLDLLKDEIIKEGKNSIDEFIFKLAIWTNKGLIYVAEVDGDGELVLL